MILPEAKLARLNAALPSLRAWIDRTLEQHEPRAVSLAQLDFERLPRHFPLRLLQTTKVITVPRVPFPPVGQLGLPELSPLPADEIAGITYLDRFFVKDASQLEQADQNVPSESLCFHELIHVVQWQSLGAERFLQAYGVGLLLHGYQNSPLEQTAFWLQQRFERGTLGGNVVGAVQGASEQLWCKIRPLLVSRRC